MPQGEDVGLTDDVERSFGFEFYEANDRVRGSIMNGNLKIKYCYLFLKWDDLNNRGVTGTPHFITQYDPEKSLISQDYVLSISGNRYACPIPAVMCVIKQEGWDCGKSDAEIFEWFWNKCKIKPEWEYDLNNLYRFDENNNSYWPKSYLYSKYRGVTFSAEQFRNPVSMAYDDKSPSSYVKPYGNPPQVIASGCTAQQLRIALIGESTGEKNTSWFGSMLGDNKASAMYYSKGQLLPETFKSVIDNNYSSIFLFTRLYTEDDGTEKKTNHAVNVVSYMYSNCYIAGFEGDGGGASAVVGNTLYIGVGNGWTDDAVYYMDVTNTKFSDKWADDTLLQVCKRSGH